MLQWTVNSVDEKYNTVKNFKEQIFSLVSTGYWNNYIKILRSHILTCQSGSASLDKDNPGADSAKAWANMDSLIDQGVLGFFHTHPSGFHDFSNQDARLIKSLAMSNGEKFIWHGVQCCDDKKAHFICANYVNGQVFIHDLGWFDSDLNDPIVLLPLPIQFTDFNGIIRIPYLD